MLAGAFRSCSYKVPRIPGPAANHVQRYTRRQLSLAPHENEHLTQPFPNFSSFNSLSSNILLRYPESKSSQLLSITSYRDSNSNQLLPRSTSKTIQESLITTLTQHFSPAVRTTILRHSNQFGENIHHQNDTRTNFQC